MQLTAPFILFADSTVEYDGRAISTLERGRYLIVAKEDGTLLVHACDSVAARNYQRPGSTLAISQTEPLIIESLSAKDKLRITVFQIVELMTPQSWSAAHIILRRTEAELVDKLCNQLGPYLRLDREVRTPCGVIDVLGVCDLGDRHVIEVKRNKATLAAVSQLQRYVQHLAAEQPRSNVIGYIASPQIGTRAKQHLEQCGFYWLPLSF